MKASLNFILGVFIVLILFGSLIVPIFAEVSSETSPNSQIINGSIISGSDEKKEDKIDVVITEEDKNYFNKELGLSKTNEIKESSLKVLVEEKNKEFEKIKETTDIAKIVEEENREIVSVGLVKIKKEFLEDMNKRKEIKEEREKIKKQLDDYVKVVEENKDIEINIEKDYIKEYFRTKDVNKLIKSMVGLDE